VASIVKVASAQDLQDELQHQQKLKEMQVGWLAQPVSDTTQHGLTSAAMMLAFICLVCILLRVVTLLHHQSTPIKYAHCMNLFDMQWQRCSDSACFHMIRR
jgi:hypothetical protein